MCNNSVESLLYVKKDGKLGGYKTELLKEKFEPSLGSFVTCSRCEGIMRDASGVGSPQEFMCSVCVEGSSHSALGPNREVVSNLIIWCPLKSRGCEWEGHISSSETHLDSCMYLCTECGMSCGAVVKRIDMERHVNGECPLRVIMCEHCTESHKQAEMKLHLEECVMFPMHCTKGCGDILPRRDMQSHGEEMCPNSLLECGYRKYGCDVVVMRKDLDTHTSEYRLQHMEIKIDFLEFRIKSQKSNYSKRTKLICLDRKIESAHAMLENLNNEKQLLIQEFHKLSSTKEQLKHQFTSKLSFSTLDLMMSTRAKKLGIFPEVSFKINSISKLNTNCWKGLVKVCHKPDKSYQIEMIEISCKRVDTSLQILCILTTNCHTDYKFNSSVHLMNRKKQTAFVVYDNTFVIVDKRKLITGRCSSIKNYDKHTLVLAEIPMEQI